MNFLQIDRDHIYTNVIRYFLESITNYQDYRKINS